MSKKIISGRMPSQTKYDHFIKIRGVNYHYREYPAKNKDARHIVFIHGFFSSTYSWENIDYLLHEEGYHVWVFDLKGFGWSDKPRKGNYDIRAEMEDLNRLMDRLGLSRVILIAHSYGGGVGIFLCLKYPKRVEKFIAIDIAGLPQKIPWVMKILTNPVAGGFGKKVFGRWMVKFILNQVYYDKKLVTRGQIDEYYSRMRTEHAADAQIALSKAIDFDLYKPYYARAGGITQKTLLIWGREDKWIPVVLGYRLNSILPDSRMVVIPHCGHIPHEEKPEVVLKILVDFIGGRDFFESFSGKLRENIFTIDE